MKALLKKAMKDQDHQAALAAAAAAAAAAQAATVAQNQMNKSAQIIGEIIFCFLEANHS